MELASDSRFLCLLTLQGLTLMPQRNTPAWGGGFLLSLSSFSDACVRWQIYRSYLKIANESGCSGFIEGFWHTLAKAVLSEKNEIKVSSPRGMKENYFRDLS